ncbi:hypothetical protein G9F32_01480 [Acinetobacter sp. 194]|uniref:hypothetical protein n=1 Tax=Acinetobacter shaoyimingii TaxID=2715164 RepID=UPI00140BA9DF|nr:hypothetical protein [Acinetobacter shaoyimingii]NHB56710.1 hypothetical protein [Acinetobacter shaoyimingii]
MKPIIFILILALFSCGGKIKIEPEFLEKAYINKQYNETINIIGGRVISNSLRVDFSGNKDFFYELKDPSAVDSGNHIVIKGISKEQKNVEVIISGYVYKESFMRDNYFKKSYIIEVEK